eukprot:scaffold2286_cov140-Skeletonema_marinoi.AAC.2
MRLTKRTRFVAKLLLLFALTYNVGADDTSLRRFLSNHRTRPHDNVEQSQEIINRDDYGNAVEVAASQIQEQEAPPQTPLRPQQAKIINGEIVEGDDAAYPFLVQLRENWGVFCTGQLIAPDVVLAAAHCGMPAFVSIWNGREMETKNVQSYVKHPDYNFSRLTNDLALIKLSAPALAVNEVNDGDGSHWELDNTNQYDWVKHPPIVRLHRYQNPSGCAFLSQDQAEDITALLVIGLGRTIKSREKMGGELLEADVHYVLNSVCNETYFSSGWITDDMICAADSTEEQDACQGDSDGALFTRLPAEGHQLFTLVGVVSWGYGCALQEYPGVYSRVAVNAGWIDENVCGELSPKSCTSDGKIRDYALEALAGGTRASRRRAEKNEFTNNSRARAAFYGEQLLLQQEVCELLGGSVDEESPAPALSSPSTTSSPSHDAPIMPLKPSLFPSDSPSLPRGKSASKKFISKNKNANQQARGLMYQMKAEAGDVVLEKIAIKTKDDTDTYMKVYFQLGSYENFLAKGMDERDWGEPVYSGMTESISSGLKEALLDDVLTIPRGQTVSIYLASNKELMFVQGDQEFFLAEDARDFKTFTGSTTKKAFKRKLGNANFYGEVTYYTVVHKAAMPSPSIPPSLQSVAPSNAPTKQFLPGELLLTNEQLGIELSSGLEAKLIASSGKKLTLVDDKESFLSFHSRFDGAGVIDLGERGYVYVSNSEETYVGVYGLQFNLAGEIVDYKTLLSNTKRNCGGGLTPHNTWISCEEVKQGQCWQVSADPNSSNYLHAQKTMIGGSRGGRFESVATDSRIKQSPVYFVTEDSTFGAMRRFQANSTGWHSLHAGGDMSYLQIIDDKFFEWTKNLNAARKSAYAHYQNSEGISFNNGTLYFTTKSTQKLFVLDLESSTYKLETTGLDFHGKGSFNAMPDQVIKGDKRFLYFTESGGKTPGVYVRDMRTGKYMTIFEAGDERYLNDETVGVAFSPGRHRMYAGYQMSGVLFEFRRTDNLPFP